MWAIGVWGSVLGSILLLLRSRFAAPAFLISLAGAAISFAFQLTLDLPPELGGVMTMVMPLIILVLIAAQYWYARRQVVRGVLR